MTHVRFFLALLLLSFSGELADAADRQAVPPAGREAYCRERFRCSSNPYGHDYQGTICRMQLRQCLGSSSDAQAGQ